MEQPCLRTELDHRADHVVLTLEGCLCRYGGMRLAPQIAQVLQTAGTVLGDLSRMEITHQSRALVFATALNLAGGWPRARLALFAAAPAVVQVLHATGVTKTVPHAATLTDALVAVQRRPPWVRMYRRFEPRREACQQSRALLGEASEAWQIPEPVLLAGQRVISELVANAVEHAATACEVYAEFDGQRLQLAVRDYSPAWPREQPHNPAVARGHGLQVVEKLAVRWGVTERYDGKTVWAVVSSKQR